MNPKSLQLSASITGGMRGCFSFVIAVVVVLVLQYTLSVYVFVRKSYDQSC